MGISSNREAVAAKCSQQWVYELGPNPTVVVATGARQGEAKQRDVPTPPGLRGSAVAPRGQESEAPLSAGRLRRKRRPQLRRGRVRGDDPSAAAGHWCHAPWLPWGSWVVP